MNKAAFFFKNLFLAGGVVWFLSGFSILIFNLSFKEKEVTMMLLLPIAYAIIKLFDSTKPNKDQES